MTTATAPPRDPYEILTNRWSWESDDDFRARLDARAARDLERIESLRLLVGLLAATGAPLPYVSPSYNDAHWTASWTVGDVDEARELRRAIGSPVPGTWSKETGEGRLRVVLEGLRLRFVVAVAGTTCEAVEVGTKVVERTIDVCPSCDSPLTDLDNGWRACSDEDCAYENQPPKRATVQVTEPEIEWRCPDLNGDDGEDDR